MMGSDSATAPKKLRLIMELRRFGIADTRVLGALERIPREIFVPATFTDQAYENVALPIGCGQTVSQPLVVARMSEALEIGPRHKVLEIGTGSGYQAAVLAKLCRRVYSIERHRELLREAEQRLAKLRIHNVTLRRRRSCPPCSPIAWRSAACWSPRSARIAAISSSCGCAAARAASRPRSSASCVSFRSSPGCRATGAACRPEPLSTP